MEVGTGLYRIDVHGIGNRLMIFRYVFPHYILFGSYSLDKPIYIFLFYFFFINEMIQLKKFYYRKFTVNM